jgi:predicted MPP superfamily phosphohydrolase
MSFGLMIRFVLLAFCALSLIAGRHTIKWLTAFASEPRSKQRLKRAGWMAWALLNAPCLYFLILGMGTHGGAIHQTWQLWFLYPYFAWLITSLFLVAALVVQYVVTAPYRIVRWWKAESGGHRSDGDRREFLAQAATALPATLLLTSGYGIVSAQTGFQWFEPELKLKDWPGELQGLRILQISDLHVGNFLPGERLAQYVEEINRKPCDLMVITGDIINNNMAWFPECMESLSKLKLPRYGSYMCIGNHDYYAGDPDAILEGMRKLGMTVVRDEHVEVPIGNSRINLAGIDYPVWGGPQVAGSRLASHVDVALAGTQRDHPTILLAHHPHAFDRASESGVQLTLSGHTHGGQFAFTPPGMRTVSLGDLMFKYVAGEYEQNGSKLYVNRGVGNWFPMRLGAPPEVTLLTVG